MRAMLRHSPHIGPRRFVQRQATPQRIFVLSFALLIVVGGVLLWLPAAASAKRLSFVDALFSSASAVCVTGLTVVDIGKDLTWFGEVTTMVLFQIGGIGIITFSMFLFQLMGRSLSFKGREILQSTFLHTPRRDFFRIIRWVIAQTLIVETIGALVLFLRFLRDFSPGQALYQAVYHSVSAFNNCGYSLFSDNLVGYQGDWVVNLTIIALIIIGGIGFVVIYEIMAVTTGEQKRLSLHSKIALITTAVLIVGGTILFYFFEWRHTLQGLPAGTQFQVALFQSVTARTCGFNTVAIGALTNSTILLLIMLMFIGASPGSTGGGVKTTSFALLVLMVLNRLKGREEINVFNRTIPKEVLGRTMAIIFASALSVVVITSVLLLAVDFGSQAPGQNRHLFVEYLFETVSAFGTVGLSMGVTPNLGDVQKIAITLMMFIGRVGPLTLAFSWSTSRRSIQYAEEPIMVG